MQLKLLLALWSSHRLLTVFVEDTAVRAPPLQEVEFNLHWLKITE
jgi:hypothetical protein